MENPVRFLIAIATVMALYGCQDHEASISEKTEADNSIDIVFHSSHEPKKAAAPFSDAVEVGDLFFLSGQIGMDHSVRELVSGGIEAETRQALVNIKQVLAQHGMQLQDVVKVTVILADMDHFRAFNEIYRKYLPHKPARTTFAANGLAMDAQIEIEVVAVRR